MSYETNYAARKRAEWERRASSPEAIAWRKLDAKIREDANREMEARYPEITPGNFQEALDFFERRVREMHEEHIAKAEGRE